LVHYSGKLTAFIETVHVPIPRNFQGQDGWGSKQPDLVEDVSDIAGGQT